MSKLIECNILTQSDDTNRPFIDALIHNQVTPVFDQRDTFMDPYACDLLCLYHRYSQIRDYLEHGFGFQKIRWSVDHAYMRRYRLWVGYWRFGHRNNQIEVTPLIRPTFNLRLTQNILYRITK